MPGPDYSVVFLWLMRPETILHMQLSFITISLEILDDNSWTSKLTVGNQSWEQYKLTFTTSIPLFGI